MKLKAAIGISVIIGAILLPLKLLFPFLIISFIFISFRSPLSFSFLRKKSLWIFLLLLVVVQTFIIGDKDHQLFGIQYSEDNFFISLRMVLRAILLITATSFILIDIKNTNINTIWEKIGIRNFGETFSEAQTILPLINNSVKSYFKQNRKKSINVKNFLNPVNFIANGLAELIQLIEENSNKTIQETGIKKQ